MHKSIVRFIAVSQTQERRRLEEYRSGEAAILYQLEERRRAMEKQAEATKAEGAALRAEAERLARQELELEAVRRAAGAALLAEVEAFNAQRCAKRHDALCRARAEDAAIAKELAARDAQMQVRSVGCLKERRLDRWVSRGSAPSVRLPVMRKEFQCICHKLCVPRCPQIEAEERAAAQKHADLALARHWASVRQDKDAADAAELRRLQRYQDEKEAAALAREEREAALRKKAQSEQWEAMKVQLAEKEQRAVAEALEAALEARRAAEAATASQKQMAKEVRNAGW